MSAARMKMVVKTRRTKTTAAGNVDLRSDRRCHSHSKQFRGSFHGFRFGIWLGF